MTPEYGSDVQLEKEALLREADVVVMNKRDFPQAEARAARVRRFLPEGRGFFAAEAKRFGDTGVTELFAEIARRSGIESGGPALPSSADDPPIPFGRRAYLGEIVDAHEGYYAECEAEADLATAGAAARDHQGEFDRLWAAYGFDGDLGDAIVEDGVAYRVSPPSKRRPAGQGRPAASAFPSPAGRPPASGRRRWACPDRDAGPRQVVRYLYKQNVPGRFPFTEGAYLHRRQDEDPIRMFAGLGLPETTNRRFHLLAAGHGAPRLSTAFDSLTLYGLDSDEPGAIAKVGRAAWPSTPSTTCCASMTASTWSARRCRSR